MPARMPLAFREPEQFETMPVRIAELDGLDTGGCRIRSRNRLRARGDLPHMVLAQLHPSRFHVAHDDRDMLEPEIVAVGGHRNGPYIRRRQKLRQPQLLFAEL